MAILAGVPDESVSLVLKACADTARVCVPTVIETLTRKRPSDPEGRRAMRRLHDQRLAWWAGRTVHAADLRVSVRGFEHVDPDRTCLVMSNHQSSYDIFVLMDLYPGTLRMIAKAEMFRIPVFGQAMQAAEFVFIERGNRQAAIESLALAKKRIDSGVNVWIAPEGTRSNDGRLLPFKKGGFMLALDSGTPILPVTVHGTKDVLPAKHWKVRPGCEVEVTFHPPVDPRSYGHARRQELIDDVFRSIDSGLPEGLRQT